MVKEEENDSTNKARRSHIGGDDDDVRFISMDGRCDGRYLWMYATAIFNHGVSVCTVKS